MRQVFRTRSRPLALPAALLLIAFAVAAPVPARADGSPCPEVNPSYTGPCGPSFQLPAWGDAGGWTDPSHYETIQLADIDGDGRDELLGRTSAGLAAYRFDTAVGQWRPVVDAEGQPLVITQLADPPPLSTANSNPPATDWRLPRYYDTIQTADIDGDGRAEVIARSAAGLIAFKFTGNGWQQLSTSGPLEDWEGWGSQPSYYYTIQAGDLNGDGKAEILARGSKGIVILGWQNGNFQAVSNTGPVFGDGEAQTEAQFYTDLHLGDLGAPGSGAARHKDIIGREVGGVHVYELNGKGEFIGLDRPPTPFSDVGQHFDCPTTRENICFGAGPGYYTTMQLADIDGDKQDELLGRLGDGLRVRKLSAGKWGVLPTLTDLSDANGWLAESRYATIQTADIDGDGRAEVLARGANGIEAWSYDPAAKSWSKLSTPPLQLTGEPWEERSHFATIQTGDVNGDHRADLIARGPYGIRTWFYNLHGNDGWQPYAAPGYRQFPAAGQQAAFAELTALAKKDNLIPPSSSSVRDVWTGENPPGGADLTTLAAQLATIGGCTGKSDGEPPSYAACTLPAGAKGFTAADWTAVLNETFKEIFWAEQVVQYFAELESVRQTLFIEQGAQLPALGSQFGLAAAATTTTEYDPKEFFSGALGIAGALAGEHPEVGIPLEIGSELLSMLPSASPELTDPFQGTYADLQARFAASVADVDKAMAAQSQYVRQNEGTLALLGELRLAGTWSQKGSRSLDKVGLLSVGREGFATAVYRTLLPTFADRYAITRCQSESGFKFQSTCTAPPAGTPGMTGAAPNFNLIGMAATPTFPCSTQSGVEGIWRACEFTPLPQAIATTIWSPLSPSCTYVPGQSTTAWNFGCNLGLNSAEVVDPDPSVPDADRWKFTPRAGSPYVNSVTAGTSLPAGGQPTRVALQGTISLSRDIRLGRSSVRGVDLLAEPGGAGELVRRRAGGRRLRTAVMTPRRGAGGQRARAASVRARHGGALYHDPPGGPEISLRLRRRPDHSLGFDMRLANVRLALPYLCAGVRPGVDFSTHPITLQTTLLIGDGRPHPAQARILSHWRCRRDRFGAVRALTLVPAKVKKPRGAPLGMALQLPHKARAGQRVVVRVRLRNAGRRTAFMPSLGLLHDPALRPQRGASRRLASLRGKRQTTIELPLRVAVGTRPGRVCGRVVARALDRRSRTRDFCLRVVAGHGRRGGER